METNTSGMTLFDKLVVQAKRVENGLTKLFKIAPNSLFAGDEVEYDIIHRTRTLPDAKHKDGPFSTINQRKYKNRKFSPPTYKERVNYSIGQTEVRTAGHSVYDVSDKTVLLMSQTAEDVALLIQKIQMGMLLQASEIFQYGKIRFSSVFGYDVPDCDMHSPAELFATVAIPWGTVGSKPINNLETHIRLIDRTGFSKVDNIIFGDNALALFLNDQDVKETLENRRIDKGNFNFGEVSEDGFQRIGIFHLAGRNVVLWSFDEYYQRVDENGEVVDAVPFIDPNNVVFYSSMGDYKRYFAGIDTIKTVPDALKDFMVSPNITIFGDRVADDLYLDTKEVDDGNNSGVYLRAQSRPLLIARTNDTFGCLKVS